MQRTGPMTGRALTESVNRDSTACLLFVFLAHRDAAARVRGRRRAMMRSVNVRYHSAQGVPEGEARAVHRPHFFFSSPRCYPLRRIVVKLQFSVKNIFIALRIASQHPQHGGDTCIPIPALPSYFSAAPAICRCARSCPRCSKRTARTCWRTAAGSWPSRGTNRIGQAISNGSIRT